MDVEESNVTTPGRRILVLGSTAHSRSVTAFAWDTVPGDLNVADFDTVILNLAPFRDDDFRRGVSVERLPRREQFLRLIFSRNGEVIAVGDPDLQLGPDDEETPSRALFTGHSINQTTWWSPAWVRIQRESGEAIQLLDDRWAFYFEHVRSYDWWVSRTGIFEDLDIPVEVYRIESIAETRFDSAIALTMEFRRGNSGPGSSPVTWLPLPSDLTPEESIDIILAERLGVAAAQSVPGWAADHLLPDQMAAAEKVRTAERDLEAAVADVNAARHDLERAGILQRLLFETGDRLEGAVCEALTVLGGNVNQPPVKGREDARVTTPQGDHLIIEIKGRAGAMRVQDARQLGDWLHRAWIDEGIKAKGLFVGNLQRTLPPSERGDVIGTQARQVAERAEIAILTTTQLFRAVQAHQAGTVDRDGFWKAIATSIGLCNLPETSDGD